MRSGENVVGKALQMVGNVLSENAQASRQNRAVPFGKPESRRQLRNQFDSLTPETLALLIKEHGRPAVNRWLGREIQLRQRRQARR